ASRWSWPAVLPLPLQSLLRRDHVPVSLRSERTGRGRTDTCSLESPASLPSPSGSPPASSPPRSRAAPGARLPWFGGRAWEFEGPGFLPALGAALLLLSPNRRCIRCPPAEVG